MSRGRKAGFVMPEEHRVKIRNSNILNALIEHVEGKREMSATQVSAGLGLLRKCLPDLTNVEVSGTIETNYVMAMPEVAESAKDWLDRTTKSSGRPN